MKKIEIKAMLAKVIYPFWWVCAVVYEHMNLVVYPFWYIWFVVYENMGLEKKGIKRMTYKPDGTVVYGILYPAKKSTKRNCVAEG